MVDFTNSAQNLVETFSVRKNETPIDLTPLGSKPPRENKSIAPEIPELKFDTKLPVPVKDSMQETQLVRSANRNAQIQRNKALVTAAQSTTEIVNDADVKIENSRNNIFGSLIGLFNDDYDVSEQQRRQSEAIRNYQTKIQVNKLQTSSEELAAQNAAAEFTNYIATQKLKDQAISFTTAEINNIIQSNSARKAYQDFAFSQVTMDDLKNIKASGNFNEVVTEQRVDKLFRELQTAQLEFEAADLAFKNDKFDFGKKMETRAKERMPVSFLRQQYDKALKSGQSRIELSKGFFVAPSEVLSLISQKEKVADDFRQMEAQRAVKLAKNNASFNDAQRGVGVLSSDFSGSMLETDFSAINMLNTNDDLMAEINYTDLHPAVASSYMAVMQFTANMNENASGVTEQDFETQKVLLKTLEDKIQLVQKQQIDSQPTKPLKAAQQEWFTNGGRMQFGANAAAVTAGNISTRPDFRGDKALNLAWEKFAENVLVDITGEEVDLTNADGDIDSNVLLENLLSTTLKGKQTDSEKIIKAMSSVDDKGRTPLTIYAASKAKDVLIQAAAELANKNANVKQGLFDAEGKPGNWQNSPLDLAKTLAALSVKEQQQNPQLENNKLNKDLEVEINKILASQAAIWNSQQNIHRGSFMVNLFKGKQPFKVVDTIISNTWGRSVAPAWGIETQNVADTAEKKTNSLLNESGDFRLNAL